MILVPWNLTLLLSSAQQIDVRLEHVINLPPLYRSLKQDSHQEISRLATLRIR